LKPKLIVVFLLIVLVPLGVVGWLGVWVAKGERERVEKRFEELLVADLDEVAGSIAGFVETLERELLSIIDVPDLNAETISLLGESHGIIQQPFLLDSSGALIFPSTKTPVGPHEEAFLERTSRIWKDKDLFGDLAEGGRKSPLPRRRTFQHGSHDWYPWFWDQGLRLIFWQTNLGGWTVGVELNRARFMADLIASLPDTELGAATSKGRIALVDSKGKPIYQWGSYPVEGTQQPRISRALNAPLASWKLDYHVPADLFASSPLGGVMLNLLFALAAIGIALGVLATYFYRENTREMRDAAQKVSFVNQVSHELKTPLTNIRLYAELLDKEIGEQDEVKKKYLNVVVQESQRLSRLIGNVLTFSRGKRATLKLHPKPGIVDDTIRLALDHYKPSLESRGVKIEFDSGAESVVSFDSDAVEQILGNLFSNVEKYAADYGHLLVVSNQEERETSIKVADNGPGIRRGEIEKIFRPFYRTSNQLSDGVTGTGIGLSIARDLARQHGGDLTLEPSESGALFRVVIETPRTQVENQA